MNLTLPHPRLLPNYLAEDSLSHFVSEWFLNHVGTSENPFLCILHTKTHRTQSHSFENYHYKYLQFSSYTVPAHSLEGRCFLSGCCQELWGRDATSNILSQRNPFLQLQNQLFLGWFSLVFDFCLGEGNKKPPAVFIDSRIKAYRSFTIPDDHALDSKNMVWLSEGHDMMNRSPLWRAHKVNDGSGRQAKMQYKPYVRKNTDYKSRIMKCKWKLVRYFKIMPAWYNRHLFKD